jgi:nucleotide-binding universal stress UspA family protein
MSTIIACLDGSIYADQVCSLGAWAHKQMRLPLSLLHVVGTHSERAAKSDLSGQIGIGSKTGLLQALTQLDEEHGKLEQQKGQLILDHAKEELARKGLLRPQLWHRRGTLVETLCELEHEAELIIIGKRGEHSQITSEHLGSNLERVARSLHKPLLVATRKSQNMERFLIAYDGSPSAQKALDYALHKPLLKGLECHLCMVEDKVTQAQQKLRDAEGQLQAAGFKTKTNVLKNASVEDAIVDYVKDHGIDMLMIGAYGHSKIRSLILGSTTTLLIHASPVPLLLFR